MNEVSVNKHFVRILVFAFMQPIKIKDTRLLQFLSFITLFFYSSPDLELFYILALLHNFLFASVAILVATFLVLPDVSVETTATVLILLTSNQLMSWGDTAVIWELLTFKDFSLNWCTYKINFNCLKNYNLN